MSDRILQLVHQLQCYSYCSPDWQWGLKQLVEEIMKSRRLCRPWRGQPLPNLYAEIYQKAERCLIKLLESQFDRQIESFNVKLLNPDMLPGLRDQAFKRVLDDGCLTQLAIAVQQATEEQRRWAMEQWIEALWLVQLSSLATRSSLYEEAVNLTLAYVCEHIDQFQPQRTGQPVQVMAWVNFWLRKFIERTQVEHETQKYRLIQPNRASQRLFGMKYELTCLLSQANRSHFLTWLQFTIHPLILQTEIAMQVLGLAAVLLSLADWRQVDRRAVDTLLFAIAEQILSLPRLNELPQASDPEQESAAWETMTQPTEGTSLLEQLRDWIQSDPDRLLQVSIQTYPKATFQAIALKYLEGQSWQSIAASFGAPKANLSTFSTFYYRQLERLAPQIRKCLQEN